MKREERYNPRVPGGDRLSHNSPNTVLTSVNRQLSTLGLEKLNEKQAVRAVVAPGAAILDKGLLGHLQDVEPEMLWVLSHAVVVVSPDLETIPQAKLTVYSESEDYYSVAMDLEAVVQGCQQSVQFSNFGSYSQRENIIGTDVNVLEGGFRVEDGISPSFTFGIDAFNDGQDIVPLIIVRPDRQVRVNALTIPTGQWNQVFTSTGELIVTPQAEVGELRELEEEVAVAEVDEKERLAALRAQVIAQIEEQLRRLGFLKESQHLNPDYIFRPEVTQRSGTLSRLGVERLPMIVFSPPIYRGGGPMYVNEYNNLSLTVSQAIAYWHHGIISLPLPIEGIDGPVIETNFQFAHWYNIAVIGYNLGDTIRLPIGHQSGRVQNPQGVLLVTVDARQSSKDDLRADAIKFSCLKLPEGWEEVFGADRRLIPEPGKEVVVYTAALTKEIYKPSPEETELIGLMKTDPATAFEKIYSRFDKYSPYPQGQAIVEEGTQWASFRTETAEVRFLRTKEHEEQSIVFEFHGGNLSRFRELLSEMGDLDPRSVANCIPGRVDRKNLVRVYLEIALSKGKLQINIKIKKYDEGRGDHVELALHTARLATPEIAAYLLTNLMPRSDGVGSQRESRSDDYQRSYRDEDYDSSEESDDDYQEGAGRRREKKGDGIKGSSVSSGSGLFAFGVSKNKGDSGKTYSTVERKQKKKKKNAERKAQKKGRR